MGERVSECLRSFAGETPARTRGPQVPAAAAAGAGQAGNVRRDGGGTMAL